MNENEKNNCWIISGNDNTHSVCPDVLTHHIFDGQVTTVTQQGLQIGFLWFPVMKDQNKYNK